MYTIKWVSEKLGLAPATLRAWEQRYGVVHPSRSDVGYRLYDDADLDSLRTMSGLVAAGMQPAQAAEEVRAGRGAHRHQGEEPTGAPAGLPAPGALVEAARSFDAVALEETLVAAFTTAGFEYVVDVWLMKAMREVGNAWAAGDLGVAEEHFISSGVMRRLAAAFDAAGNARFAPHVVVGLAPGSRHQIAALAFATMLRRAGLRVTYLGADLPVSSWADAVRTIRPDAAIVGTPRVEDNVAAAEVIAALLEVSPGTQVFLGGQGALPENALQGDTLAQASQWLARRLTGS
ncbi:B12 binding domain-containing protein [Raineyella antarctica]|uniref:B12 binding domain-containing protein n=1 Tax=Raineyella antarctica TaxID=1577474 RepID=A0A1G6GFK5_9ACTN|nr:MerR family transcriptional regulator [Raineyella antarctica]SDB80798.1 B12 binding domain-containing protein [Raineyella antarctica]